MEVLQRENYEEVQARRQNDELLTCRSDVEQSVVWQPFNNLPACRVTSNIV
jgi:hypothetical protein